jgi:hypothetical protein
MKDTDNQLNFDFFASDETPQNNPDSAYTAIAPSEEQPSVNDNNREKSEYASSTANSGSKAAKSVANTPCGLRPRDLKQAALAWAATLKPSALAIGVPTRISRFKADVAAVWSAPGKKRLLHPVKTLIIEVRRDREACWPDCSRREEMLTPLRDKKAEKKMIEADIRSNEPELRETDTLFEEYESWNYAGSRNKDYKKCLKKVKVLENALYQGSRFERIAQANVADFLYLAVPAGAVEASELAEGWGLLYINADKSVEIVREADDMRCAEPAKAHLAFNIAAACAKSLLFSEGILIRKNGIPSFTPIPKRRRPKQT